MYEVADYVYFLYRAQQTWGSRRTAGRTRRCTRACSTWLRRSRKRRRWSRPRRSWARTGSVRTDLGCLILKWRLEEGRGNQPTSPCSTQQFPKCRRPGIFLKFSAKYTLPHTIIWDFSQFRQMSVKFSTMFFIKRRLVLFKNIENYSNLLRTVVKKYIISF